VRCCSVLAKGRALGDSCTGRKRWIECWVMVELERQDQAKLELPSLSELRYKLREPQGFLLSEGCLFVYVFIFFLHSVSNSAILLFLPFTPYEHRISLLQQSSLSSIQGYRNGWS
jgi:hypothetical protein